MEALADLSREEFLKLKEEATKQMRELYGGRPLPPFPDFVSVSGASPSEASDVVRGDEIKKQSHTLKPASATATPSACGRTEAEQGCRFGLLSGLNLKGLMANPDNLLIIGLILVLLADGADEKLILALVFIML